jgi:hypothetical protein
MQLPKALENQVTGHDALGPFMSECSKNGAALVVGGLFVPPFWSVPPCRDPPHRAPAWFPAAQESALSAPACRQINGGGGGMGVGVGVNCRLPQGEVSCTR